jgi:hypothetical protein
MPPPYPKKRGSFKGGFPRQGAMPLSSDFKHRVKGVREVLYSLFFRII